MPSSFRYGFLLLESVASQDPLSVSVAILKQFNILPEMYQVGYTKLFFRTGQVRWLNLSMHLISKCALFSSSTSVDVLELKSIWWPTYVVLSLTMHFNSSLGNDIRKMIQFCRLECLKIQETVLFMGFCVFRVALEAIELEFTARSLGRASWLFIHVFLVPQLFKLLFLILKNGIYFSLNWISESCFLCSYYWWKSAKGVHHFGQKT